MVSNLDPGQILQMALGVISTLNLLVLNSISRRMTRIEDIFINKGIDGNGVFLHRRQK